MSGAAPGIYLLDLVICVRLLRDHSPDLVTCLNTFQGPDHQVGLSAITYGQLCAGVGRTTNPDHNRRALDELRFRVECIYPWNDAAAAYCEPFGEVNDGSAPAAFDRLLQAHALALDARIICETCPVGAPKDLHIDWQTLLG